MADNVGRRGFLGKFLQLVGVAAGAGAVAGVAKKAGAGAPAKPLALGIDDAKHQLHMALHEQLVKGLPLVDNMSGLVDGLSRESWVASLDNVTDLVQCPVCCEGKGHVGLYPSGPNGSVLVRRCRDCDTAHMNAIGIPTGAPKWTVPPHDKFVVGKEALEADQGCVVDPLALDRVRASMISGEEREAANIRLWDQRKERKQRADEDREINDAVAHEALAHEGDYVDHVEIDSMGHVVSVSDVQAPF